MVSGLFFWPSGVIHSTGDMQRGRRHGKLTQFNEDGVKVTEGSYTDDVQHGTWTFWRADGTLWGTAVYELGQLTSREPVGEDD
jgi:antitoxin component YwqK of YwqJK toxin-antitoxin module